MADVSWVALFNRGLQLFASLLGLQANPQKNQLILSKAAHPIRDTLLILLAFRRDIFTRIQGWDGIRLSFAGRVQLIKSILMALEMYWAMAFILPKGIIKEIEKRLRTFLWKGSSSSGYPKVAWEQVCKPSMEGGQGIRDIQALNRALMSRHLWAVIKRERYSI
ncbi:UNVERIFIED_CONTAM: hypothetical protein Sradi_3973300 [Sesamum radiatum]|uniref:Uncharacterized protein n=1 Tax=Sesamum radiatum TaxID=300843 RepID=A0AAW2PGG2_SESRA